MALGTCQIQPPREREAEHIPLVELPPVAGWGHACLGPLFLIPEESSHQVPTSVSVCGGCASLIKSLMIPSSVPRGPEAEEEQGGLSATGFGNTRVLGIPFALLLHLLCFSAMGHLSPGLHSLTWATLLSSRAGIGTAPGARGSSSPPGPPGAAAHGRAPRAQPASRRACGWTDRVGGTCMTGLVSAFPLHPLGKQTVSFELSKAYDKTHVPEQEREGGRKAHEQTNHPKISPG